MSLVHPTVEETGALPNMLVFAVIALYLTSEMSKAESKYAARRGTASYRPVLREGGIGAPGGLQETECRTSAGGDTQASGDGRKPQKKAAAVLLRGDGLCRWGARCDRR